VTILTTQVESRSSSAIDCLTIIRQAICDGGSSRVVVRPPHQPERAEIAERESTGDHSHDLSQASFVLPHLGDDGSLHITVSGNSRDSRSLTCL
jgi:hypothetical protein